MWLQMVRDAFDLAKEKCLEQGAGGAIIFIDELDAIGTKRFGGEQSGDREVQRTMLELLNQLDGFEPTQSIKVPLDPSYSSSPRGSLSTWKGPLLGVPLSLTWKEPSVMI